MKTQLLCPNCGHHIADLNTQESPPGSLSEPARRSAMEPESVHAFIEERCVVKERERVLTKDFRTAYLAWCEENEEPRLSPQTMGRVLAGLSYIKSVQSNGKRYYTGITLA